MTAVVATGMLAGCGSSSDEKASGKEAGGKVYYLNFKPEADEYWQELAEAYTDETGVPVTVLTAASGEYEKTLKSGLQSIPGDVIEAAQIDGASRFQRLWKVTVPMMMPSITICVFLSITNGFKLFDQNLSLTAGEPSKMSEMMALNIFNTFYGRTGWEGVGQAKMVMFTLSLVADRTGLRTPWGIILIYLGFGAGLAVFMFCGFVKSIPLEIEEAAMIDGCTPLRTFFSVVLPIMKPTYISVGILETMWIWNDFLLPYLVLDLNKYKTISIAIQYMKGSYGRVDMGAVMAALILAVIPVVIFYLSCQKHIIKGVAAGAVKG